MKLEFSTNLKCGGCVASLKPFLDAEPGVDNFEVDLESEEKILTVTGDNLDPDRICELIRQAGYEGKAKKSFFGKLFG